MRFHNFWCISFVSSEFLNHVYKLQKSGKRFVQLPSFIRIPKKHFYRLENSSKLPFSFPHLYQAIMDKSLGALLHFWSVFQFRQVQPLPSPHKQCWTRVSRIFSDFQLCVGWGRENCKKISKTLHCFKREPRNNRKYEYCSIVPRTFVQDCSNEIRAGAGREKQYGRITFPPKKKRFCCHSLEYCSPITMPL